MSISKIATIIQKLHDATADGKVEWEQTEREDVFQTAYPDFAIRIHTQPSKQPDPDADIDYVISVFNSQGALLESATDVDLASASEFKGATSAFSIMKELYDSAKGYALGIEQTLDSIIDTLSEPDIPF